MEILVWRKSSYTGANGGNCVELARTPNNTIATRDSKAPNDGMLRFSPHTFGAFLGNVKRGKHDV